MQESPVMSVKNVFSKHTMERVAMQWPSDLSWAYGLLQGLEM